MPFSRYPETEGYEQQKYFDYAFPKPRVIKPLTPANLSSVPVILICLGVGYVAFAQMPHSAPLIALGIGGLIVSYFLMKSKKLLFLLMLLGGGYWLMHRTNDPAPAQNLSTSAAPQPTSAPAKKHHVRH